MQRLCIPTRNTRVHATLTPMHSVQQRCFNAPFLKMRARRDLQECARMASPRARMRTALPRDDGGRMVAKAKRLYARPHCKLRVRERSWRDASLGVGLLNDYAHVLGRAFHGLIHTYVLALQQLTLAGTTA
jgi:hypothetical protein